MILNSVYQDGQSCAEFNPTIANGTVDIAMGKLIELFQVNAKNEDMFKIVMLHLNKEKIYAEIAHKEQTKAQILEEELRTVKSKYETEYALSDSLGKSKLKLQQQLQAMKDKMSEENLEKLIKEEMKTSHWDIRGLAKAIIGDNK